MEAAKLSKATVDERYKHYASLQFMNAHEKTSETLNQQTLVAQGLVTISDLAANVASFVPDFKRFSNDHRCDLRRQQSWSSSVDNVELHPRPCRAVETEKRNGCYLWRLLALRRKMGSPPETRREGTTPNGSTDFRRRNPFSRSRKGSQEFRTTSLKCAGDRRLHAPKVPQRRALRLDGGPTINHILPFLPYGLRNGQASPKRLLLRARPPNRRLHPIQLLGQSHKRPPIR